jgi:hypothetical protein
MNSIVIAAVTTPSATHAARLLRVNPTRRGRRKSRNSRPAHARRSQAAPSGPIWSISPTATATPDCTDSMAATAIAAPVRASVEII